MINLSEQIIKDLIDKGVTTFLEYREEHVQDLLIM